MSERLRSLRTTECLVNLFGRIKLSWSNILHLWMWKSIIQSLKKMKSQTTFTSFMKANLKSPKLFIRNDDQSKTKSKVTSDQKIITQQLIHNQERKLLERELNSYLDIKVRKISKSTNLIIDSTPRISTSKIYTKWGHQ